MKYYIVAGEASGDLHGSNLMKEIKLLDTTAEFRFWGGDLMQAQGGTLVSHYKSRAFMGLWEVIKNLRRIIGFLKQAKADLILNKPDVLILIDNPGFNLRVAHFAKKNNIAVHYYIAPKVWAWNTRRVNEIQKNVTYLYSILPFEPDFFKTHKIKAEYVGNPVLDSVSQFKSNDKWLIENNITKPVIALLPGSRISEIDRIVPTMLQIPPLFPDYDFIIAAAPDFNIEWYQKFDGIERVKIVKGETYELLSHAAAALVASGTATLETALFGVPQVVCYRVAPLTFVIGKIVVKLKWFGLVNLILNRELLKELLQKTFTSAQVEAELKQLLIGEKRIEILEGYNELNKILGPPGASKRVAELVIKRA
jgi:lipid-A-disaccharide synthase